MFAEMKKIDNNKKKRYNSKTLIEDQKENEIVKINTTFDFANLYASAAETSMINKKIKHKTTNDVSNKKQNIIESSLEDTPIDFKKKFSKSKLNKLKTSTPNAATEKHSTSQETVVKSIMKNNVTLNNNTPDVSSEISTNLEGGKRKKRTKSVSFMLDDSEEVSLKKCKPNKIELDPSNSVSKNKENRKNMKQLDNNECYTKQLEQTVQSSYVATTTKKKKKKAIDVDVSMPGESEFKNHNNNSKKKIKGSKNNSLAIDQKEEIAAFNQISGNEEFLKAKKDKKKTKIQKMPDAEIKNDNTDLINDEKNIKNENKKKHKHKMPNTVSANKEEPDKKFRKTYEKADIVVDDLESLTIGDNAHTLTNLLDEMTVTDKNKKYKIKNKIKKNMDTPEENSETDKIEKKDNDKWKKRRLNKKPEFRGNDITTSIVIDSLPLRLLFDYKNLLREHFAKFGLIRRIGVAEVYPTEEPKPVFTTTVYFFSEEAATSALEEDNSAFHKGRMRVRRPLPPTETTLIVKCHSPLDESILSSTFLGCGRIRSIRKVEKSKKSISSAFIEFSNQKEVEKAINLSSTLRIGGKKVYVAKFEIRNKKHKGEQDGGIVDENGES